MTTTEKDLASVLRVRNRLAASPDSALPKIFTGLLPRLLSRLDHTNHPEMILHVKGIFSHSLERVRLNRDAVVAPSWVHALLENSNDRTVGSWTQVLPLLEEAIPAVAADDEYCFVAPLIRLVDHFRDLEESNLWKQASWVLLDAIASRAGMPRFVDWERDALGVLDGALDWSRTEAAPCASSEAQQAVATHGNGFFDLLMDLISFSPLGHNNFLSSEASARMQYRRQKSLQQLQEILERGDEEPQLQQAEPQRQARPAQRLPAPRRRRVNPTSWAETEQLYLRHLKLACMRLALWPPGGGVFANNSERSMILAIMFANGQTKHGKIAADYLCQLAGGQRLIRDGNSFRSPKPPVCSLTVANSLLMLLLGDHVTEGILLKQARTYPAALVQKYRHVLGPPPEKPALKRQGLWSLGGHALDYIRDNMALASDTKMDDQQLFLELSSAVPDAGFSNNQNETMGVASSGVRWKTHILYRFYKHTAGHGRGSRLLQDQSWATALAVLSTMGDRLEDRRNMTERMRNDRTGHQRLLIENRRQIAKHSPVTKDAVVVRRKAYELFAAMLNPGHIVENGRISFAVALPLLRCAANDQEKSLALSLQQALVSLLDCYKATLRNIEEQGSTENDLQRLAMPLLLPLLDAACTDSDVAREFAVRFSTDLLYHLDPLAAWQICTCLVDDETGHIKELARTALRELSFPMEEDASECALFFKGSDKVSLERVYEDLRNRTALVRRDLGISESAAQVLLQAHGFSVAESIKAMRDNRNATVQKCGIAARVAKGQSNSRAKQEEDTFCQICYDEVSCDELFSLDCGDQFCRDCWKSSLEVTAEGVDVLSATCPRHDCSERVTADEVGAIAPGLVEKWRDALLQSFLQKSKEYSFCTGPNCTAIASCGEQLQKAPQFPVRCSLCDTSFCFMCREKPHEPAPCDVLKRFNEIMAKMEEHDHEKMTKECPGCGVKIQKNGGCNHMTCRCCSVQFCWICLSENWADHVCNQYGDFMLDDDNQRAEFFNQRVEAQRNSEAFALRQLDNIDTLEEQLERKFRLCDDSHILILKRSLEILVTARRFLVHSYVASFGFKDLDANTRQQYETQQAQLQIFTERLSFLTDNIEGQIQSYEGAVFLMRFRAIAMYSDCASNYISRVRRYASQMTKK